jgi:ketosteroid isomerase-like protein
MRAAIDKTTQSFVEAFSRGDVDRVAAHLSEGAELISDEAPPLRGRDAIVKALTNHFAENPKKSIVREVESLRFKSKLAVTEEGLLKVSIESEAPKHMRYSLDLIHEDAKWLIVSVHEWPEKNADLMDLEWLIGTWEAKRADAEMRTTYEWFGSKAYIRATISLREKDQIVSTMQMIGIDPRTDELRILTFEADGGFAEGTCTREGNTWIFESHGVLADGGELSAKNILVRVNSDTTTWQPISLQLGDETIEGIPPLKMTRVKPAK